MTAPTSGIGSWGETGGRLSSCVRESGPINFSMCKDYELIAE